MTMMIKQNVSPARLKLLLASLLLLAGGYSAKSEAAITTNSCSVVSSVGDGFKLTPAPAKMYDGFVVASQNLNITYKYTKTGTAADELRFGSWFTDNRPGPFTTIRVYNSAYQLIPGLGFRFSSRRYGLPATSTPFETVAYSTVTTPGTFNVMEPFLLELIVTDASQYRGGKPGLLENMAILNVVMGNMATFTDKSLLPGGQRCVANAAFQPKAIFELGGVTIPELPPPTLPTCDLGGTDISVDLDPVDASQLATSGASAGTTSFTIPLGYCGKDAKPYITLTDSADITNRSSNLTLAPSSTAKGVRIKLTKGDGSPLQLGAQNKTVSSNNVGQFLVGTSPADNTPMSVKLNAAYVRTNDKIEAGSVKADAIFTIAYP